MTNTELMHRWSRDHPLPVHVNDGELTAFVLISPMKPPVVKSSRAVSVSVTDNHDGRWKLEFRLNQERYQKKFESFYNEVYSSTWKTDINHAAEEFISIYNSWKRAFSTEGFPLTDEEVQGLIGEMSFIRDVLSREYKPREILTGWMLIEKGKQDFIFSEKWYEVKTTFIGSNCVTITSLEQLDCPSLGYLSVIKLKKTSANNPNKVTLGLLVRDLQDYFDQHSLGEEFLTKIGELGLPSDLYEERVFEIDSRELYRVEDDFPRLKRSEMPVAVGTTKYELYLEPLRKYKV